MPSDSAMSVDDDRLLVLKSAPNGRNHAGNSNANGLSNGKDEYSSMSEDDDLPLVCFHSRNYMRSRLTYAPDPPPHHIVTDNP